MGLAYLVRYGFVWNGPEQGSVLTFVPSVLGALLFWGALSMLVRLDGFRGGWNLSAVFSQLLPAAALLMLLLLAANYLSREYVSRLTLGYFGALLFVGVLCIRVVARLIVNSRYRAGAVRRVVIVGNGPVAREIAAKIDRHPETLWQVVGFLSPAEGGLDLIPDSVSNTVTVQTLGVTDVLQERNVDEIILALPKPGHPEVLDLAARCRNQGIAVCLVPHPYELYLSKPQLLDLDGLPLLQLREKSVSSGEPIWKRAFDLVVASFLLILSWPVVGCAAGVLKWKKEKAFRAELRCGQNGKPFSMYRLNSDRDGRGLPNYELLLQRLSLTELPQLWNVLRGEMSLVGPRPEPLERVRLYSDWQRQRLTLKPGMTGLAQVHGLRDQHSSEEKARFDLQYMLNPSPFLDVSLLLQTLGTLAGRLFQPQKLEFSALKIAKESDSQAMLRGSLTNAHSTQSSAD
jgi:lipopolysaccharide/colanic/teichoic acid biosynthesis glycosyltransferase